MVGRVNNSITYEIYLSSSFLKEHHHLVFLRRNNIKNKKNERDGKNEKIIMNSLFYKKETVR